MTDYTVELVNQQTKLGSLADRLSSMPLIAVDIETVDWWNRRRERVALVQIAFRQGSLVKVAVVDALAALDLESLRPVLESETITKIIHNAVFDASRLRDHYQFRVAPIFDTMVAARRNREPRYSLLAQAQAHLNLRLDKAWQKSDWSRRPLDARQIYYAASDASAALLLGEHQTARGLNGAFQLKETLAPVTSRQNALPLTDASEMPPALKKINRQNAGEEFRESERESDDQPKPVADQSILTQSALLGIVTELPGRYHPGGLAVSVGAERVGLAGWIADRILGKDTDLDEETAKLGIIDLLKRKLVIVTEARRLEATPEGASLWAQLKSKSF